MSDNRFPPTSIPVHAVIQQIHERLMHLEDGNTDASKKVVTDAIITMLKFDIEQKNAQIQRLQERLAEDKEP